MTSYSILRMQTGWITNENGDFLLEDTENHYRLWIPNNIISFDEFNQPCIREEMRDTNTLSESIVTVKDVSHEFMEAEININNQDEVESQDTEININNQDEVESQDTEININNQDEVESQDETKKPSTPDSNSQVIGRKHLWSANETLALISAVEPRYEDMHHVQKRKHFWNIISEVLCSQNIKFNEAACKKKWFNLLRTYKTTKDIQGKTGRGPVKFEFFNKLDEILGNSPSNACDHSIDVSEIENHPENSKSSSNIVALTPQRKRKNTTLELIKAKTKFYEKKIEKDDKNENNKNKYLEETLKLKHEKMEIYKKKIELEERKLKLLEEVKDALKKQI